MPIFQRSPSNGSTGSSRPLLQRTSSTDVRRDYNSSTLTSLLGLLKLQEFLITVDHFSIWRRHLAWAMEDGKDLRAYMTQRYASNMVFMSLLLSIELAILFNSAPITTLVRHQLLDGDHWSLSFWAGLFIILSALLTILSLISTFTAWSMVNAVDEQNAHCIFRSSIGQYAVELPGRLIVGSIYSFLISFILYFFLLLPFGRWSIMLLVTTVVLFVHIVSTFSALGRVIMHSGAMGKSRIFTPEYEEHLLPQSLHSNLLAKSRANLENNTSIIRQYRRKQNPIDRYFFEDEIYDHLCGRQDESTPNRSRRDSIVRFVDEEDGQALGESQRTLTPIPDSSSVESREGVPLASSRPQLSKTSSGSNNSLDLWLKPSPRHAIGGNDRQSSTMSELSFGSNSNMSELPFGHSEDQGLQHFQSPVPKFVPPKNGTPKTIHQELSNDERFTMDYGDVEDRNGDSHHKEEGEQRRLLGADNQNYQPYLSTNSSEKANK